MPADTVAERKSAEAAFSEFPVQHTLTLMGSGAMAFPGSAQVSEDKKRIVIMEPVSVVADADRFQTRQLIFYKRNTHFRGFSIKGIPDQLRQCRHGLCLGKCLQMVFPYFNGNCFHLLSPKPLLNQYVDTAETLCCRNGK
jgi:hypothetical protein